MSTDGGERGEFGMSNSMKLYTQNHPVHTQKSHSDLHEKSDQESFCRKFFVFFLRTHNCLTDGIYINNYS